MFVKLPGNAMRLAVEQIMRGVSVNVFGLGQKAVVTPRGGVGVGVDRGRDQQFSAH